MTRVLVCGGRDYGEVPTGCYREERPKYERKAHKERSILHATLDTLRVNHGVSVVIHGGARGADNEAGYWARCQLIEEARYLADWNAHGKAAGPIRNQRMIDEGKPDLVIAFPGGRGTADMVGRAKAAGVEVQEIAA